MEFNTNFSENLPPHSSFSTKKPYNTLIGNEISTISYDSYQNVLPFDNSVAGRFLSNPALGYESHFYDPFISSETLSANESIMHLGCTIGSNSLVHSLQTTEIPNYNTSILFQDPNSQPFNGEGYLGSEYQIPLNENLGLNNDGLNQTTVERKDKPQHSTSKGLWTPEEDSRLIELVEKYGNRRWTHIAGILKGRVGKQCRERWLNHLTPYIKATCPVYNFTFQVFKEPKKEKINEKEEVMIVAGHQRYGSKWASIAKDLPGRTENAIKNHFNATKRRLLFSKNRDAPNTYLEKYIMSLTSGSVSTGVHASYNLEENEQVLPALSADLVSPSLVGEENNHGVESLNPYFPYRQFSGPVTEKIDASFESEHKDQMLPSNDAYVVLPYYPLYSEFYNVAPIPGETPNDFSVENNSSAPNLGGMGCNMENDAEFLQFAGWN